LGKFSVYGLSGGFDVYQGITEFCHGSVMVGAGGATSGKGNLQMIKKKLHIL
jgi:hypothetical protein